MAIVGRFLQLGGQSDRYMDARKRERNTYRSHGSIMIVLKQRRTWGNEDVMSAVMSLVPTMFCKALQRSHGQ